MRAPAVREIDWPGSSGRFRAGEDIQRIALAWALCTLIVAGLIFDNSSFAHWFVIPVILCGALIGSDAIALFQQRIDFLDPVGIVGVLGVHFFFVAPLMHIYLNEWMQYITPPPDWRPWIGYMSLLNFAGLLLYRFSRRRRWFSVPSRITWRLTPGRTAAVFLILLVASALLQCWTYLQVGGISGYIDTYMESQRNYGKRDDGVGFVGMGGIFTLSETFPVLAMFMFVHYARESRQHPRWTFLFVVLGVYFLLVMLFGGLRGSRSNTIWALFWAVGLIHCWVRKMTLKVMAVGTAFLLVFMYLYGFYKDTGLNALSAFRGSEDRAMLSATTGRTLSGSLLGDLGRSDVQAFTLYKEIVAPDEYDYAWGRSYLGALAVLIPYSLWPDRPETKIVETTQLETGRGSYIPGVWQSSRVYGLAGEAMLNFGPVSAPLAFVVLGFAVGLVRDWAHHLHPADSRWLLVPLLVMFSFQVLVNDSDNNVFFLVKYGFVPVVAILASSTRYLRSEG